MKADTENNNLIINQKNTIPSAQRRQKQYHIHFSYPWIYK